MNEPRDLAAPDDALPADALPADALPTDALPADEAKLTEIFRDANAVKVQFLAAALDEAALPFTLHETWADTVETGGQEHRLLVRECDLPAAREVIMSAIAGLPDLQARLRDAFPDEPGSADGPGEPRFGEDPEGVPDRSTPLIVAGWILTALAAAWSVFALTGMSAGERPGGERSEGPARPVYGVAPLCRVATR